MRCIANELQWLVYARGVFAQVRTESATMLKSFWKVHGRLELRTPSTQAYQYADSDETLEEVTMPGTTDSPDDVRAFRTKVAHTIQSYIVSRSALEASATRVSE